MTGNRKTSGLCDPDPWKVVSEAREQRGPIVAQWFMTIAGFLRTYGLKPRDVPKAMDPAANPVIANSSIIFTKRLG